MIAPHDTFVVNINVRMIMVLAELNCLIDPSITVAKVCGLRIS